MHDANYLCVIFPWRVAQGSVFTSIPENAFFVFGLSVGPSYSMAQWECYHYLNYVDPWSQKKVFENIRGLKMQVSKFGFEGHGTRSKCNALFGNLARSRGRNLAVIARLLLAAVGAAASSRQWQLLSGNGWTINELTVGVGSTRRKKKELFLPFILERGGCELWSATAQQARATRRLPNGKRRWSHWCDAI